MKFGQLIEYNVMHVIHFFFKTHAGNESGRLVPYLFLLLKKASYEVKARGIAIPSYFQKDF